MPGYLEKWLGKDPKKQILNKDPVPPPENDVAVDETGNIRISKKGAAAIKKAFE